MKFTAAILLATVAMTSAFAPSTTVTKSGTKLHSSFGYNPMGPNTLPGSGPGPAEFFPLDIPMKRIEGGGTVRTWDIPTDTERLQYVVETNGRPLKAKVEL